MTEPVGAPGAGAEPLEGVWAAFENIDNAALLERPLANDIASLYVLNSLGARLDSRAQLEDIRQANEERHLELERQQAALEAARKAEDDKGWWGGVGEVFGTVARVAGCVAAVGLAVATAGAATPIAALAIAGAVASCTSFAQAEWGVLDGALGEHADRVGFWLGMGGAAASLGVGILTWGAPATYSLLTDAAAVAAGSSAAVAGGAKIVEDHHGRKAAYAEADATRAWLNAQLQQFLIQQLIDGVSETKERETANVKRVVAMVQSEHEALTAAVQGVA